MLSLIRLKELTNIFSRAPQLGEPSVVALFLTKYLVCEVMARRLQEYYAVDRHKSNQRKNSKQKVSNLNVRQLEGAAGHFGLALGTDVIRTIFPGGTGKRGYKSARQLRNGYLHELSSADKSEIEAKHVDLMEHMEQFIEALRL